MEMFYHSSRSTFKNKLYLYSTFLKKATKYFGERFIIKSRKYLKTENKNRKTRRISGI